VLCDCHYTRSAIAGAAPQRSEKRPYRAAEIYTGYRGQPRDESFDQALDWDRVAELRKMWDGPVILKGILDVEDAKKAANLGVDAIIVSNHGGRGRSAF